MSKHWEIRLQYPRIERISVEIIFDEDVLKKMFSAIREYKKKRRQFIDSMREENTEEFCVCTACSKREKCSILTGVNMRVPTCGD